MQYSDVNGVQVSRFALGTKRLPTEDSSRVVHLDADAAGSILDLCIEGGVNLLDTSYSNHKGEAEAFLGDCLAELGASGDMRIGTSFFEMVDPRYDYVFQKQLKKLRRDKIDFYTVEGITGPNKEVNVDSGAIAYLFERKEAGQIGQLGFSSELPAADLREFIGRFPWDFVRLRINYLDWFHGTAREAYETVTEAGLPVMAHGALRTGAASRLKDAAVAVLKEACPERSTVAWAFGFVESLPNVRTVSCNVHSPAQAGEAIGAFSEGVGLGAGDLDVLKQAAEAQRTVIPGRR